jgi:hypothetical protein
LTAEVLEWRVACEGARASFSIASNSTRTTASNSRSGRSSGGVDMLWTVPAGTHGPVTLRVAAATSMGNVTITAAVLNASYGATNP